MIFDDAAQKMVLEFTCPTPVLGVRMKRDKVLPLAATVTKIEKNLTVLGVRMKRNKVLSQE